MTHFLPAVIVVMPLYDPMNGPKIVLTAYGIFYKLNLWKNNYRINVCPHSNGMLSNDAINIKTLEYGKLVWVFKYRFQNTPINAWS